MLLTGIFVTNNLCIAVTVLTHCHAKLTKNTIFQVNLFLRYCTYMCVSSKANIYLCL